MIGDFSQTEDPGYMNECAPADAWKTCYRELAPKLLLFARQWVAEPADAEDVVQTAFVKFWRKQPDAAREHYPLLYAAVRSTALDLLRRSERPAAGAAGSAAWLGVGGSSLLGCT